jgi:hypothetical protein
MSTRAFRLFGLLVAAAAVVTGTSSHEARAQETRPAPPATRPPLARASTAVVRRPAEAKPAPPATSATPDPDPYRCHPNEDIACTVVRETLQGLVIATFRGRPEEAGTWTVVSSPPPGAPYTPGGTVYVVPSIPRTAAAQPPLPPNGAPIID